MGSRTKDGPYLLQLLRDDSEVAENAPPSFTAARGEEVLLQRETCSRAALVISPSGRGGGGSSSLVFQLPLSVSDVCAYLSYS